MPGRGTGTFIDPDDCQASLRQARIDLLVTSRGAFKARLTAQRSITCSGCAARRDLPRIAYLSLAPAFAVGERT